MYSFNCSLALESGTVAIKNFLSLIPRGDSTRKPTGRTGVFLGGKILSQRYCSWGKTCLKLALNLMIKPSFSTKKFLIGTVYVEKVDQVWLPSPEHGWSWPFLAMFGSCHNQSGCKTGTKLRGPFNAHGTPT